VTLCCVQDYNEDGQLSFSEFSDLIKAFGNQVADKKVWPLSYVLFLVLCLHFIFCSVLNSEHSRHMS